MLLDSLSPKQIELLNSKTDITFYSCGAGSGFSTASSVACNAVEKSLVITDTSGMLYSYKDTKAVKCKSQQLEHHSGEYYDLIVIEENNFRKDIFRFLPRYDKLIIRALPTLDAESPTYRIARELILNGKKYISFSNGFPYLSENDYSLMDVFGGEVSTISLIRADYRDNPWIATHSGKKYEDALENLCRRDRDIYMHGKWNFE
jgi:hypothetical protein